MPSLVFATRHPIKDWENIKDNADLDLIPDLDKIIATGVQTKAKAPHTGVTTTNGNEPITGSLYYARYMIDGVCKEIFASAD